jgi:hypothetical protein
MFKDLFERSGYEDDGIYDWDLVRLAKLQAEQLAAGAGATAGGARGQVGGGMDTAAVLDQQRR